MTRVRYIERNYEQYLGKEPYSYDEVVRFLDVEESDGELAIELAKDWLIENADSAIYDVECVHDAAKLIFRNYDGEFCWVLSDFETE